MPEQTWDSSSAMNTPKGKTWELILIVRLQITQDWQQKASTAYSHIITPPQSSVRDNQNIINDKAQTKWENCTDLTFFLS